MLTGVINTKARFRRVRQATYLPIILASKEGRALSGLFWPPLVPDNATQNSGIVFLANGPGTDCGHNAH